MLPFKGREEYIVFHEAYPEIPCIALETDSLGISLEGVQTFSGNIIVVFAEKVSFGTSRSSRLWPVSPSCLYPSPLHAKRRERDSSFILKICDINEKVA
jgi:hypothetical protein